MIVPTQSSFLRTVATPPIPAAREWARGYAGGAGPMIDLTQAVPGYPAHPDLLERLAIAAGDAASARYGDIAGDIGLREALAADMTRTYAAPIAAEDVAITAGCNLAFSMAMVALAGPGTSVLLPAPWYFNHQMACAMLGITPRALPCAAEAGFVPDPELAASLIDASTRAIVLVTPNNPTGAIYPPETIARFAALCRDRGLFLVLDETYRDFLPADARPHELFADPAWRDHVVQLYSFSKSYCIPGHRLGAIAAGPAVMGELIDGPLVPSDAQAVATSDAMTSAKRAVRMCRRLLKSCDRNRVVALTHGRTEVLRADPDGYRCIPRARTSSHRKTTSSAGKPLRRAHQYNRLS